MNKKEAKDYVEENACEGYFENQVVMPKEEILALLDKIDQPKSVVPEFVAEWLKKYRYAHTLLKVLNAAEKEQITPSTVNDWILDNQYDFIKAWLDGYEIEKEKQWAVKDDTGYLSYLQFSVPNIYQRETSLDKNDAYKFKSKSKADLFADLVAGTVEEVE